MDGKFKPHLGNTQDNHAKIYYLHIHDPPKPIFI